MHDDFVLKVVWISKAIKSNEREKLELYNLHCWLASSIYICIQSTANCIYSLCFHAFSSSFFYLCSINEKKKETVCYTMIISIQKKGQRNKKAKCEKRCSDFIVASDIYDWVLSSEVAIAILLLFFHENTIQLIQRSNIWSRFSSCYQSFYSRLYRKNSDWSGTKFNFYNHIDNFSYSEVKKWKLISKKIGINRMKSLWYY